MRVAAVDIGTNSTRLLVGDVRHAIVTRLGEGVDATRRLSPAGIARVQEALELFAAEIGDARTLAVATSAVRDAENGAEFMRGIAERFGFETRILSGDEEAMLTRIGVGAVGERTLILDVGGGSTELIAGSFHTSLELGSVRLTERYLDSDPPTAAELNAAVDEARSLLPNLEVDAAVGVAGTVAQLHQLTRELTIEAVDTQLLRLASLPLAERRRVPGLDPERARAIVGGALIVREVLCAYGLESLEFSEKDLLDGVLGIVARSSEL